MSAIRIPLKKKPAKAAGAAGPAVPAEPFDFGHIYSVLILLMVSLMAGVSFDAGQKIFVAGEIATQDIAADQGILIEDRDSTNAKREQVANAQPAIFDLSMDSFLWLEKRVREILEEARAADADQVEQVRWQISESLNTEVRRETVQVWRDEDFQRLLVEAVLPWLKHSLGKGVVADARLLNPYKTGIMIRDAATTSERLDLDLHGLKDLAALKDDLDEFLRSTLKLHLRNRKAAQNLLEPFLAPSLSLNAVATQLRRNEVTRAVDPVYYQIKKGEIIVRQGERVSLDQQIKLQALFSQRPGFFQYHQAVGLFLVLLLFHKGLSLIDRDNKAKKLKQQDMIFLGSLLMAFALLAKILGIAAGPLSHGVSLFTIPTEVFAYCLPVAGASGVMALFFPTTVCFFAGFMLSFICSQILIGGLGLLSFFFLGSLFNIMLIKRTETRAGALRSVLPLTAGLVSAYLGSGLIQFKSMASLSAGLPFVLLGVILSMAFILTFSPMAETLFGYTSRFRLMELMNLEQPLLQELMVGAPGTYHHSLIVSNMVEAAARAIGANPLLARVAGLYHDIGKLKNPQYFIENQFTRENKHDKLTPSMSSLILISHVKKGAELANAHKIGREITDIILQHHGTGLIAYFYSKAQDLAKGEPVREQDYRYPGPKPQTKEAALILLADAIEASGRTLVDPTPARIKGHIDKMIRKIYTDGELDESELTLKDLHLAGETFHRILTGIFHQRIEYPGPRPEVLKADAPQVSAEPGKTDETSQPGQEPSAEAASPARPNGSKTAA